MFAAQFVVNVYPNHDCTETVMPDMRPERTARDIGSA